MLFKAVFSFAFIYHVAFVAFATLFFCKASPSTADELENKYTPTNGLPYVPHRVLTYSDSFSVTLPPLFIGAHFIQFITPHLKLAWGMVPKRSALHKTYITQSLGMSVKYVYYYILTLRRPRNSAISLRVLSRCHLVHKSGTESSKVSMARKYHEQTQSKM